MFHVNFETRFLVLLSLGVAGILVGVIGLLFKLAPPRRAWLRLALALGIGLVLVAEVAALTENPYFWLAALGLVGTCGLALVARLSPVSQTCVRIASLAANPTALWCTLLLGSLVLTSLWLCQANGASLFERKRPPTSLYPQQDLVRVPGTLFVTDRGRPVPVYLNRVSPEEVEGFELPLLEHFQLLASAVRVAPVDPSYDCHGWVFAGGRYWVLGDDLPAILEDNGYQQVDYPQVGDLAIYGVPKGPILHSGVVRVAGHKKGDLILIESKWDELGRFLHQPTLSCYRAECLFFHTNRPGGHRLRGV